MCLDIKYTFIHRDYMWGSGGKEESCHAKANSAGLIQSIVNCQKARECKIKQDIPDEIQLGSVRREIFIAFAQPGAANSLHPLYFSRGMKSIKS
jgi:hypothetical protein